MGNVYFLATTTVLCYLMDARTIKKLYRAVYVSSEHLKLKDTCQSKQILLCQSTFLATANAQADPYITS